MILTILHKKEIIPLLLIAIVGIVLTVLLSYLVVVPILLLIFYLISVKNKKKTLLWIVIVTLFTLVGELNSSLRLVIQLLDIGILAYLFLFEYGLDTASYPKVPKLFITFLILYYFSIIISIILSDYPLVGIGYLIRQTVFFAIAYALYSLIKDESDVKNYFYALIFAAVVMASSSLFTFMFNSAEFFNFESGSRDRIAGIISNPNNIANFYLVAFPFLIISLIKKKIFLTPLLSWLIIALLSFALVLTISRSAILGILISVLIIFYFFKRRYLYFFIVSAAVIVGLIFINDSVYNYLSLFLRIERGVTGRDYLWELSINIIKDNPFFGLGPGGYKHEMFNYLPVMMDSWIGGLFRKTYEVTDGANLSHSYYLFLFSELGVLGFMVSIFLLVLFLRFFKLISRIEDKTSSSYYIVVALLAIGLSEFVRGLVESIGILYFGAITADLPFWLVFISLTYYSESKFANFAGKSELNFKL